MTSHSMKYGNLVSPIVRLDFKFFLSKSSILVQNQLSEEASQGPAIRHGSQQLKMARYGYTTDSEAPVSPVLFNHRFLNLGMRYNNGIFIIEDPGYYRIEIKS